MTEHVLAFGPTTRLRRLAAVAVVGIVAAVVSARGELAVVAAAPLVWISLSPRGALPRTVRAAARLAPTRCVEEDEVSVAVDVRVAGADRVEGAFRPPASADATYEPGTRSGSGGSGTWVVRPHRWGRYRPGPVPVRVVAGNGLWAADVSLPLEHLVVYPGGAAGARAVAPRDLPPWFGEHPSRAVGSGVEFAGVRPYAPGDRRRDIDWRTSARQQQLFVRAYAAERSFALVLVLDVSVDAGEPGRSTLDVTVRGATGLAQTSLAAHDRVGLVALGGWLTWLQPAPGVRQLHRIAEAVMAVRLDDGEVGGGIEPLPAPVLPRGAFVCVLSPLLDGRLPEAVRDLRGRGHPVVVVDVLTGEPQVAARSDLGRLARRVWSMDREATRAELAALGVAVVPWDGSDDLSGRLLHTMRALRTEARA